MNKSDLISFLISPSKNGSVQIAQHHSTQLVLLGSFWKGNNALKPRILRQNSAVKMKTVESEGSVSEYSSVKTGMMASKNVDLRNFKDLYCLSSFPHKYFHQPRVGGKGK
jgi:hypothetical protein